MKEAKTKRLLLLQLWLDMKIQLTPDDTGLSHLGWAPLSSFTSETIRCQKQ